MTDSSRFLELSDGRLTTEDGSTFNIYKIALAKKSKYFRSMFVGPLSKSQHEFKIPGIRGDILGAVLSFTYFGKIEIKDSDFQDLLVAADYLLLEDLVTEIKKISLTTTNCVPIFLAALKIVDCQDLARKSFRYLMLRFENVFARDSPSLSQLPHELLKQLLGHRSLCVRDEAVSWAVLRSWIEADIENRRPLLPSLLLEVAVFDPKPGRFLESAFEAFNKAQSTSVTGTKGSNTNSTTDGAQKCNASEQQGLVSTVAAAMATVRRWMPTFFNAPEPKRIEYPSMSTSRRPPFLHLIAHCSKKVHPGKVTVHISYDDELDYWRKLFDTDGWPDDLLASRGSVYMKTGGSIIRYSFIEKGLTQLPRPGTVRENFAVAALGGILYAVGGDLPQTNSMARVPTNKVEAYSNSWREVSPMFPLTRARAIAMGKTIYVIGKALGDASAMVAQSYSPETDQWSLLPPPTVVRTSFQLVEYKEKLHVLGGYGEGQSLLRDVEIFDPEQQMWGIGVTLPANYPLSSATVLNGELIVQPDYDYFVGMKADDAWMYDEEQSCWSKMDKLSPFKDKSAYRFVSVVDEECVKLVTSENRDPGCIFKLSPLG